MGFNARSIIIRGMDYGETDRIIRLVIENRGKASAIAKGARKEKSRLREAVEPFTCGNYMLNPGRNMYTISQAEIIHPFLKIKSSLEGLLTATFLCELTDEFLEEGNPDDDTFMLLLDSLKALETDTQIWSRLALYFEIRLHMINGIFPDLHQCARCGSTKSAPIIKPDFDLGGALCSICASEKLSQESYPIESLYIIDRAANSELIDFANASVNVKNLIPACRIISGFTRHYIGKRLKSRMMLDFCFDKAAKST